MPSSGSTEEEEAEDDDDEEEEEEEDEVGRVDDEDNEDENDDDEEEEADGPFREDVLANRLALLPGSISGSTLPYDAVTTADIEEDIDGPPPETLASEPAPIVGAKGSKGYWGWFMAVSSPPPVLAA